MLAVLLFFMCWIVRYAIRDKVEMMFMTRIGLIVCWCIGLAVCQRVVSVAVMLSSSLIVISSCSGCMMFFIIAGWEVSMRNVFGG